MKIVLQLFVMFTILDVYGLRINISSRQEAINYQQKIVKAIRQKAYESRRQKITSLLPRPTILKTVKPTPRKFPRQTFPQHTKPMKASKTNNPKTTRRMKQTTITPLKKYEFERKTFKPTKAKSSKVVTSHSKALESATTVTKTKTTTMRKRNIKTFKHNIARYSYNARKPTISRVLATYDKTKSKEREPPNTNGPSIDMNFRRSEKVQNNYQKTLPKDETSFAELMRNNVSDNLLQLSLAGNLKDRLGQNIFSQLHERESIWEKAEGLEYTPPGYYDSVPDFIYPREINTTQQKSGRRYWFKTYDKWSPEYINHMMELMKDMIYDSQDRLKSLNSILDRYAGNVRFQIGYTFPVIESLNYDIRLLWTNLRRNFYWALWRGYGKYMPFHTARVSRNIIYYTYIFQKYIDVTYIVEQISDKYESHLQYKRKIVEFYRTSTTKRRGDNSTDGFNTTESIDNASDVTAPPPDAPPTDSAKPAPPAS